jgi:hypothetical protein
MSYESYPEDNALQVAHKLFHYKAESGSAATIKVLEKKLAALLPNTDEKSKKKAMRLAGVKLAKAVEVVKP